MQIVLYVRVSVICTKIPFVLTMRFVISSHKAQFMQRKQKNVSSYQKTKQEYERIKQEREQKREVRWRRNRPFNDIQEVNEAVLNHDTQHQTNHLKNKTCVAYGFPVFNMSLVYNEIEEDPLSQTYTFVAYYILWQMTDAWYACFFAGFFKE